MNFQEFVNLTRPVIGGKSSSHKFVRTLFDAILSDDGRDILDDYSENTYKAYANGRTQITNIAKAISPHIDPVEFATFIYQAGESAQLELCERFISYLPSIDARNVGEELADLFADIIREAAGTKRKSAPKDAKTGTNESAYDASFGASVNPSTLSAEDLSRLKEFREESRDILKYIIKNDPSAGPTEITLSDEISGLIKKWQFSVREIENSTFRKLVLDILNQLREYTYYISEVFLRYIPGRDILWFRNESREEGNRLRNEFQPKSYELRCEIARLYEMLYSIPEDTAQDKSETIEAEVVDDEEPSGAAAEDKKITVIQQQTNVIQNGENNFNLTNNGTMNFDLKGGGV